MSNDTIANNTLLAKETMAVGVEFKFIFKDRTEKPAVWSPGRGHVQHDNGPDFS